MKGLDRKLLRDLIRMKGQVLAIALVVACGVISLIAALSTYASLRLSRDIYYQQSHFADVFVSLKRAPEQIGALIANVQGIAELETRIVVDVILDAPGIAAPPVGRMISLPKHGTPALNRLYLRQGRLPEHGRLSEILISEAFAKARQLRPGDSIKALINGKYQVLNIVGVALSPEYVYSIRGASAMPDDRQFGIIWINHDALAAAFDMEGAFNDAVIKLSPNASLNSVIRNLDNLLRSYGTLGAYPRTEQLSHRFMSDEIKQLGTIARAIAPIFLGVAAFLLNIVLARIVGTQREQIATLKALGYRNSEVAWHYLKLVILITLLGIVLGVALGTWLGQLMTAKYVQFFRLPVLRFHVETWIYLLAVGASTVAALVAALSAVRRVVKLSPAEGMRPPPPVAYRGSPLSQMALSLLHSTRKRMIFRSILGRPVRALFTVLGISLSLPIVLLVLFWRDSLDYMITVQFRLVERSDAVVSFTDPVNSRAIAELVRLPGVKAAEGMRTVPVRLRAGYRSYRTSILGLEENSKLRNVLNSEQVPMHVPTQGLLLTDRLAERLNIKLGDPIEVEVLEGERLKQTVIVAGLTGDLVGLSAYMDIQALRRLLKEGDSISAVSLLIDPLYANQVYKQIKQFPKVSTVTAKAVALKSFEETTATFVLVYTTIMTIFAVIIAVGVVYNNARIMLSERSWELASLRVLGFTRNEVSGILLAELAIQVLLAIPLGLWLGYLFVLWMMASTHTETFRIPVIIEPGTYAISALIVTAAAILAALVVRQRVNRLDLVAALKTKE